jgi:hypothetical protein
MSKTIEELRKQKKFIESTNNHWTLQMVKSAKEQYVQDLAIAFYEKELGL